MPGASLRSRIGWRPPFVTAASYGSTPRHASSPRRSPTALPSSSSISPAAQPGDRARFRSGTTRCGLAATRRNLFFSAGTSEHVELYTVHGLEETHVVAAQGTDFAALPSAPAAHRTPPLILTHTQ